MKAEQKWRFQPNLNQTTSQIFIAIPSLHQPSLGSITAYIILKYSCRFYQHLPTFWLIPASPGAPGVAQGLAECLRPSAARAQWCEPRLRWAWGVFGTQKRWKDIINHQTSTKLKSYLFLSVFWWLYGGLIFSFLHQQDWCGFPHKKQRTTFHMLYSDLSIYWILK